MAAKKSAIFSLPFHKNRVKRDDELLLMLFQEALHAYQRLL
jgi:hypothetical protein